ncbi:MAG TPA: hypothetical protein VF746_00300 [Longimicrobium sp.]
MATLLKVLLLSLGVVALVRALSSQFRSGAGRPQEAGVSSAAASEGRKRLAVAPSDDVVARTAVLILRAVLPADAGVSPDRVRILPDAEVLTDQLAAARLASMDKPLKCRPAAADGVLELACSPLSSRALRLHEQKLHQERGGTLGPAGLRALRESSDGRILVVGRSEEVALRPADFERLEREFVFAANYAVAAGPAAEFGYDPREAAWVEEYGPTSGVTRVVRIS